MPQNPYVLTAVDVRRQSQPDSSRLRIINQLTVPAIKNKTIAHTHGGGTGTVNYVLPMLEAFTPTFETFGPDLDSLAAVGLLSGNADSWIFAGAYLLRGASKPVGSRVIITGVVAEIDEGQHSAGGENKVSTKHAIHEVTHYERWIEGTEYFWWDIDEGYRVMGRSVTGPVLSALGL